MSDLSIGVLRSIGMGTPYPEAPPEQSPHLSAFGFPAPMKRVHKAITAALNRVPLTDRDNNPLRDALIAQIRRGTTDDAFFHEIVKRLGESAAREDLMQKRISQMTPIDLISDKRYDTPDAGAVAAMKEKVIGAQNKRFAEMQPKPGKRTNEWDMADLANDDGPSF